MERALRRNPALNQEARFLIRKERKCPDWPSQRDLRVSASQIDTISSLNFRNNTQVSRHSPRY